MNHSIVHSSVIEKVKDWTNIETYLRLAKNPTMGKTLEGKHSHFGFAFWESTQRLDPHLCLFLHSSHCMLARLTFSNDIWTTSIGFTKKECLDLAMSCDPVNDHRGKGKLSVTILTC